MATTIEDADLITDWGFGGAADKLATNRKQIWHETDTENSCTILYGKGDGSIVLAVLDGVTTPLQTTDFEAKNAPSTLTLYGSDNKLKVKFNKNSVTVKVKDGNADGVSETSAEAPPVMTALGLTGINTFPSGDAYFRLKPDNNDDAGLFSINRDSGVVSWKSSDHDYGNRSEYSFTIEYVVGTQSVAAQAVTVEIEVAAPPAVQPALPILPPLFLRLGLSVRSCLMAKNMQPQKPFIRCGRAQRHVLMGIILSIV